jgi:hypothetical protein
MSSLETPVADLEVSVRTSQVLAGLGVKTLGDVLAAPVIKASAHVIAELTFLFDELGVEYTGKLESVPYHVPEQRRVGILHVRYVEGGPPTPTTRMGGAPSGWSIHSPAAWPKCGTCARAMRFVGQIAGPLEVAGLHFAKHEAVQLFACLDDASNCTSWEPFGAANVAVIRHVDDTVAKTSGASPFASFAMELHPAFDDDLLADSDAEGDEAWAEAFAHGQHDKLGGHACAGNDPKVPSCPTCQQPMTQLAQLGSDAVPSPFADGTMFVHVCPKKHGAALQYVR